MSDTDPRGSSDPANPHEELSWDPNNPNSEPYTGYLPGPEVVPAPDRVLATEIVRRVERSVVDSQGCIVPWERRAQLDAFRAFIARAKKSPGGLLKSDGSYRPMDGEVLACAEVWRRIELGWFENEDPENFGQYVFGRIHVDRWFATKRTSMFAWQGALTVDWELGPLLRYAIRKSYEYEGFLRTKPQAQQVASRLLADWKNDGLPGLELSERTASMMAMMLNLSPRSSPRS